MSGRDDKIRTEAGALWREVFGEPPPAGANGRALLDLITQRLPEMDYERLRSPHLRPADIAWPRQGAKR